MADYRASSLRIAVCIAFLVHYRFIVLKKPYESLG